jgi:hypothetical protein
VTSRTAVYGPVRTVVWQGSAGDRRPYAVQTPQGLENDMSEKAPSRRRGALGESRATRARAGFEFSQSWCGTPAILEGMTPQRQPRAGATWVRMASMTCTL